jgi:hypothetical protein
LSFRGPYPETVLVTADSGALDASPSGPSRQVHDLRIDGTRDTRGHRARPGPEATNDGVHAIVSLLASKNLNEPLPHRPSSLSSYI